MEFSRIFTGSKLIQQGPNLSSVVGDPLDVATACLDDAVEVLPSGYTVGPLAGHDAVCSAWISSIYRAGHRNTAQPQTNARG